MKKLTLAIPAESHKKLKVLAAQTEQTKVAILLDCIDERYEEMEAVPEPGEMQPPGGGCDRCGAFAHESYRIKRKKLLFSSGAGWMCRKCLDELEENEGEI